MVIGGRDVLPLLKKTGKEIGKDKIPLYAGHMAYTFFFSLFPLLLFCISVASLVIDKAQLGEMIDRLSGALPADVASLVTKTIRAVAFAKGAPGILSFGILTAAWSGSSLFGSFRDGLNDAYDVTETRPWWKQQVVQLGSLVFSAIIMLFATVVLLDGEGVVQWIGDHLHLGHAVTMVWTILQFPLAFALVVALLWGEYYFLPNCRHQNRKYLLVGSVIAAALWGVATLLFRLYVQKFHAMNPAYGAIGAIMVLLTWMYYTSFVLLSAGELNAELNCGTALVEGDAKAGTKAGARAADSSGAADRDRRSAEERHVAVVPVSAPAMAAARSTGDGNGASAPGAQPGGRYAHFNVPPARGAQRGFDGKLTPRSIGALIRELAEDGLALVKREIALARMEVAGIVKGIGVGTGMVASGGVMGLLGALTLFTGLILLPGDQWMRDQYWLAALLFAVIAGGISAFFARQGLALLSPARLAPDETVTTLQEDAQWLKHEKQRLT